MRKRILVIAVVALVAMSSFAQQKATLPEAIFEDSTKVVKNSLVQKVDSLEHELTYLKLSYELSKLCSSLETLINKLTISAVQVQLNMSDKNYDIDLYSSFKNELESSINMMKLNKEYIDALSLNVRMYLLVIPFTENEQSSLNSSIEALSAAYKSTGAALNLFDVCLKAYKKSF